MLVKVLGSGRVVTALHVGAGNVRQCFPKQIPSIEFELDHLRIECELARDFWKRRPEIRDCRLCLWLKFKFLRAGSVGISTLLAMIPTGLNLYKLELANINGQYFPATPDREWKTGFAWNSALVGQPARPELNGGD